MLINKAAQPVPTIVGFTVPEYYEPFTATAAEVNMACDNSVNAVTLVATKAVSADESGTTFFLNHATEFTSTLPAPANGLRYKFICAVIPSGANFIVATNAAAAVIQGLVTTAADGGVGVGVDEKQINFVADQAAVGDWIELISDGTNWYASGACAVAAGITFTAP
jgi:hypothetical protein